MGLVNTHQDYPINSFICWASAYFYLVRNRKVEVEHKHGSNSLRIE